MNDKYENKGGKLAKKVEVLFTRKDLIKMQEEKIKAREEVVLRQQAIIADMENYQIKLNEKEAELAVFDKELLELEADIKACDDLKIPEVSTLEVVNENIVK